MRQVQENHTATQKSRSIS